MNLRKIVLSTIAGISLAGAVKDGNAQNPGLSYENCPASAISQNHLERIKSSEGYSPTNYVCPTGHLTIGYGHKLKNGEKFNYISKDEAEVLLLKDLANVERVIRKNVAVGLTDNQYGSLVSLGMNIGESALSKSTLLKKINARDNTAANEFDRWVYGTDPKTKKKVVVPGLVERRAKEKALFLTK